jgi:hypothetical protein
LPSWPWRRCGGRKMGAQTAESDNQDNVCCD